MPKDFDNYLTILCAEYGSYEEIQLSKGRFCDIKKCIRLNIDYLFNVCELYCYFFENFWLLSPLTPNQISMKSRDVRNNNIIISAHGDTHTGEFNIRNKMIYIYSPDKTFLLMREVYDHIRKGADYYTRIYNGTIKSFNNDLRDFSFDRNRHLTKRNIKKITGTDSLFSFKNYLLSLYDEGAGEIKKITEAMCEMIGSFEYDQKNLMSVLFPMGDVELKEVLQSLERLGFIKYHFSFCRSFFGLRAANHRAKYNYHGFEPVERLKEKRNFNSKYFSSSMLNNSPKRKDSLYGKIILPYNVTETREKIIALLDNLLEEYLIRIKNGQIKHRNIWRAYTKAGVSAIDKARGVDHLSIIVKKGLHPNYLGDEFYNIINQGSCGQRIKRLLRENDFININDFLKANYDYIIFQDN